jgi:hypothetical protein
METGIYIQRSLNNTIVHNNFLNNTCHIDDELSGNSSSVPSVNWWNEDYPGFGNYWSNHNGMDSYSGVYQNVTGADGIGDFPYAIDDNNNDMYPLMKPHAPFATDLNDDGTVDIVDITIVAKSYESTLTDKKWDPRADLNCDGVIDIIDISRVAVDFGKVA